MLSSYKVFLPADTYMFKVNIRNTRKRYEICSKSTIKTPVKTDVFIVKFEHISHFVLLFSLLTLSMKAGCSNYAIVEDFFFSLRVPTLVKI